MLFGTSGHFVQQTGPTARYFDAIARYTAAENAAQEQEITAASSSSAYVIRETYIPINDLQPGAAEIIELFVTPLRQEGSILIDNIFLLEAPSRSVRRIATKFEVLVVVDGES